MKAWRLAHRWSHVGHVCVHIEIGAMCCTLQAKGVKDPHLLSQCTCFLKFSDPEKENVRLISLKFVPQCRFNLWYLAPSRCGHNCLVVPKGSAGRITVALKKHFGPQNRSPKRPPSRECPTHASSNRWSAASGIRQLALLEHTIDLYSVTTSMWS